LETRLLQDLHVDSLDVIELLMTVEDEFGVSLPEDVHEPADKQVFTRPHFRMRDFAELVYMRQGIEPPVRRWFGRRGNEQEKKRAFASFTQLGGKIGECEYWRGELHEKLSTGWGQTRQCRRSTDGMVFGMRRILGHGRREWWGCRCPGSERGIASFMETIAGGVC
jgi:hypothetical protein